MSNRIILPPPPRTEDNSLNLWLKLIYERVGEQGTLLRGIALADLPPHTINVHQSIDFTTMYYVHDANAGSGTIVYSDGTDWIDLNTLVAVV